MQEFKGFKMWFSIMWRNWYIQLFAICIAFIVLVFTSGLENIDFILALTLPIVTALVIAFKGFYQFWNDLKNDRSR